MTSTKQEVSDSPSPVTVDRLSLYSDHSDNPLMKLVDAAAMRSNESLVTKDPPVESIEIENASCSSRSDDESSSSDYNEGKVVIGTKEDLFRANTKVSFAEQLMDILDDEKNSEVIAWMPDGESFTIVNHRLFVMHRMQKLFKIQNMVSTP